MKPEELDNLKEHIESVIQDKVNGKIDRLTTLMESHNEKHEEDMKEVRMHITEVRPYLDGAKGVKALGDTGKWIAGVGGSLLLIWAWITGRI